MPDPLTKVERRILDFLIEYLRENTYQPSIREIGRRFNIKSTKTVSEYLQALADKGWIERDPSRSRGVRLLGLDLVSATVNVPVYGAGGADGGGGGEVATLEGYELDRRLAGGNGTMLVTMKDDSMVKAGIQNGDLLLVEPAATDELESGDVVAVRFGAEITVKRYVALEDGAVLESAEPDHPGLDLEDGDLTLLGLVIGVVRQLRAPLRSAPASIGSGAGGGAAA